MEYVEFEGLTYEVLYADPTVARFYSSQREHRFIYILQHEQPAAADQFTTHPNHLIVFPCYRRVPIRDGGFEDVYEREEALIIQRNNRHVVTLRREESIFEREMVTITACPATHVTNSYLRLRKLLLLNGQD